MKPLKEWVEKILAIKPERTLDEIYRAMHGFYSREQILTVWKPDDEDVEDSDPDDSQISNQTVNRGES